MAQKIIFTTCGKSLLTNSSCWAIAGIRRLSQAKDATDRDEARALNEAIIKNYVPTDKTKLNEAADSLAGMFIDACWRNDDLVDLPAELASLRALEKKVDPSGNNTVEKIVLIHSADGEGAFCAKVIGKILERMKNLTPALFVNKAINIESLDIPLLDPMRPSQFNSGLKGIWSLCLGEVLKKEALEKEIIFNLTGGYKAMSITLAGLAATRQDLPITIAYLHETATLEGIHTAYFNEMTFHTGYNALSAAAGAAGPLSIKRFGAIIG